MVRQNIRVKKAFTIIEVVIFLAITGLIFVGATVGIGRSLQMRQVQSMTDDAIATIRERYNNVEAMQVVEIDRSGSEYYRCGTSLFSSNDVARVSKVRLAANPIRGPFVSTGCLVYGEAIILGDDDGTTIKSVPLIGMQYSNAGQGDQRSIDIVFGMYSNAVSNIYINDRTNRYESLGYNVNSKIQYGGRIENADGSITRAVIFIVHDPTGTNEIHTFIYPLTDDQTSDDILKADFSSQNLSDFGMGGDVWWDSGIKNGDFYLCLSSGDRSILAGSRRTIKIESDASGSSNVKLIDADSNSEDNYCQNGQTPPTLNNIVPEGADVLDYLNGKLYP